MAVVEVRVDQKVITTIHLPNTTGREFRNRLRLVQDIIANQVRDLFENKKRPMYGIRVGAEGDSYSHGPTSDLDALLDAEGNEGGLIVDLDTGEPLYRWRSRSREWRKINRGE